VEYVVVFGGCHEFPDLEQIRHDVFAFLDFLVSEGLLEND